MFPTQLWSEKHQHTFELFTPKVIIVTCSPTCGFFCALLTCAYYKIYCSNSFKKKRLTNTAELKEWERLECCICCFPKQNNFHCLSNFFFATGAAQDSQFCSRTSEWDDTRCHRGSNTLHYSSWRTASLCSSRHLHVPNTHSRARQPDGKSSTKQRFNICCRDVSKTSFASPFPLVVSSHSFMAMGCRRDSECPLDAAIKFHFAIMLAKVSLNPSQR